MLRRSPEAGTGLEKNQETQVPALSPDEIQTVLVKAQLRLLSYDFRSQLVDLQKKESENSEDGSDRELLNKIMAEASGEVLLDKETAENILKNRRDIVEKADDMLDVNPNFAQLSYATLAKAEQISGEDYSDSLRLAQEIGVNVKDEKRQKISDFQAEAILMGILRRQIGDRELPNLKSLAETATQNPKLFQACALALPEDKRDEFLGYLPQEIQAVARKAIDKELSKVLGYDKITKAEAMERESVKERLGEDLKIAFEKSDIGHGLLLEIIDSLKNLGGEDSKRLLLEIGLDSLKKEKDPIKALTKNSQLARLIKKLFEIDRNMGGNLAMKFLARQEVPDSLFQFMAAKLAREEFLAPETAGYLKNEENFPWLRRLIAEYPNQFNTVISTIAQLPDYRPAENQEEIFAAIEDLGSLTPIIFSRYHEAGPAGRRDLAQKIKDLKPRFFRNEPIDKILPKADRDILVEMVYLSYKPVGMSFSDVGKLMDKLKDQTEDLKDYKFPADGYDFILSGEKKYELKRGEETDFQRINLWRDLFDADKLKSSPVKQEKPIKNPEEPVAEKGDPSEAEVIGKLLEGVIKAKTEFSLEDIGWLLKPLKESGSIREFLQRYQRIDADNIFNFLAELQEMTGIFFKDNFRPKLAEFLSLPDNKEMMEKLSKILGNPKRQKTLEKLMSGKLEADWSAIDMPEELASVLSQYISEKAISPWRAEIKREIKKFQVQGGNAAATTRSGFKAYISKNVGSFFAKASAGICTAQDIGLFNRDDHFHINIVERDEKVRGNIQAYVINDNNGRSLVLRGFNPNSEFLKNIDVEAFCEKVLDVGQQFVKDNGLHHLYITEQDSGWHALSNRTEVFNYLKRYLKERTAKSHSLIVSSSKHSIGTIYQVS